MSRRDNSIKNIKASLFMTFVNVILGFVCQRIFAHQLGSVNLGINGLFSNIISFLSIADLGIGTAIVFNMYKPLFEKDEEKVKSLMDFYKKSYHVIACVIIALGLIISIFLPRIIGNNNINIIDTNINIYIIFSLFLSDTVFSYLLTYKRSMLYANQRNYIINNYHTICIVIMYLLQIFSLIVFKNFYIYLVIRIIFRLLENIFINIRVNKEYPYLNDKKPKKLDKETNSDIKKRVKASVFHNVGGYIVLSTDNLIISNYLGIDVVGLYSSYLLIINALNSFINQIFNSIIASVGNLLVEENQKKINKLCDNFNYINFFIYSIAACMLYACVQPFVTIWLGEEYLLSNAVAIILAINFYFQGMRQTMQVFAQAGGIVYENRFVPLIESVLNILFSIILVKIIGLSGVFIGTIISSFAVHFYSYPKYIYKLLLKRNGFEYIKQFLEKTLLFFVMLFVIYFCINAIIIKNVYLSLGFNFITSFLISAIPLVLVYKNHDSFKYLLNIKNHLYKKKK